MANITVANLDAALKQIYKPANFNEILYKKRPFYGMVRKTKDFGGRNMPIVLQYSNSQGRSATFADAQANVTGLGLEDFLLTRVKDYSIGRIDGEAMLASASDPMSFLKGLKGKTDGAINALADTMETALFRDGFGSICQLNGSAPTGSVFVLANIENITNIEVGMKLQAADEVDGGTPRDTGTATLVTAVDRTTGTVSYTGGITGWVAADYMFVEGDTDQAGTVRTKLAGFAAWIPAAAPASTAFFGVDRTVDTRLSGQRYATAGDHDDQLIEAAGLIEREGGNADVAFVHHTDMRQLNKLLQGQANSTYYKATGSAGQTVANIGYNTIKVNTNGGTMDVIAANKCPAGISSVMDFKSWTLACLGEPIGFLNADGNKMLRMTSEDAYETRLGFYGNLFTNAPAYNCHLTFA